MKNKEYTDFRLWDELRQDWAAAEDSGMTLNFYTQEEAESFIEYSYRSVLESGDYSKASWFYNKQICRVRCTETAEVAGDLYALLDTVRDGIGATKKAEEDKKDYELYCKLKAKFEQHKF